VSGLRFDHIAVAVPRIADAMPFLVGVLGGVSSFGMLRDVFAMAHWTFEGGGRLELLEPIGADGFVHRFIATRGAGIHHVTFKVPSLDEACRRAEARGYRIIGRDETDPAWQEAFLHPRQALGIVVQFAQDRARSGRPRRRCRRRRPRPCACWASACAPTRVSARSRNGATSR
jgi:methylmalonyl-CoA/ethylmalonyl-CoA epimerase